MMSSLVDFHCHLDLYPNMHELIEQCEAKKIFTLTMTTTPKAWPKNHELTKDKKFVRAALGLHPQLVGDRASELLLWEKYLPEAKYIGEVGLDAGPKFYSTFELQQKVFDRIVELCSQVGSKILSVHSVRTVKKVLGVLQKHDLLANNKVVLHWFSGSLAEAREAIEMGCYFSINSQMLSSGTFKALMKILPAGHVLTETDGPFTSRNGDKQTPSDISHLINELASLFEISSQDMQERIFLNLKKLLS